MEPPGDMMGYDRAITLFNPDGRILQVEYAKRTVSQGFAAVGLVGKECIVFVADRKAHELEKLIIPESIEKIFQIDLHMAAAISGMIADGRMLIDKAQNNAQEYKMTYNQPADILLIVKGISAEMQALTQYGGARPFGVSILFGGIKDGKAYLYMLDPSGTFFQYKAIAIGGNLILWREKAPFCLTRNTFPFRIHPHYRRRPIQRENIFFYIACFLSLVKHSYCIDNKESCKYPHKRQDRYADYDSEYAVYPAV